jgi:uncharacterized membrane protein
VDQTRDDEMGKGRIEAFSDGVIAIIITIMVLELKVPHGTELSDLAALWPVFLSYVLSFVNVGIYWNNHHHLFHAAKKVSGPVLWANLHLMFWLSLMPFATAWAGENHFAPMTIAVYALDLMMCAVAYTILQVMLTRANGGAESIMARALGGDVKGKVSLAAYVLAIPLAFVSTALAGALIVIVALIWFIPDRRIEKALSE